MPPRWSPGKFLYNVTHNTDVAAALWRCATWIDEIGGRQKADELAGETIQWHNEKKHVGEVEGVVAHNVAVKAPLFNLVGSRPILLGFYQITERSVVGQPRSDV